MQPLRIVRPDDPAGTAESESASAAAQLEPTAELLAELQLATQRLESASPQQILKWAVERFAPHFTMATAFGPEGMCIIHMLSQIAADTPIVNLDTGYQFPETLELRERVKTRYGIEVKFLRPALTVAEYEAANDGPVYSHDPDRCCAQRKTSLMAQAAQGFHAWAVGIRRDQSEHRAQAPIIGWDKKYNLVKVSPLATWTKKDVWALIVGESIPYNPLHDQDFPSIGCWPCTRKVLAGEDDRAGRWSGFAKTECGLHTKE